MKICLTTNYTIYCFLVLIRDTSIVLYPRTRLVVGYIALPDPKSEFANFGNYRDIVLSHVVNHL